MKRPAKFLVNPKPSPITVGAKKKSLDVLKVANKLGAAEVVKLSDSGRRQFYIHAFNEEMARRLRSTGGRPTVPGTQQRKVAITDEDWQAIKQLAESMNRPGLHPSPGQVAGVLLSRALTALQGRPAVARGTAKHPPLMGRWRAAASSTDTMAPSELIPVGSIWVGREKCKVLEHRNLHNIYIVIVASPSASATTLIMGSDEWPIKATEIPNYYEIIGMRLGKMDRYLSLHKDPNRPANFR